MLGGYLWTYETAQYPPAKHLPPDPLELALSRVLFRILNRFEPILQGPPSAEERLQLPEQSERDSER